MWDHIINIYLSELLNTKTKEFKTNESFKKKKKVPHNNFFIFYLFLKDNLYFIPNNILTKVFKELIKYKNDYQQYLKDRKSVV